MDDELKGKIEQLIQLVADSAMVGSKQGHGLSDLKTLVAILEEHVKQIKEVVEKVEKRFTLTKILATMFTIVTTAIATITACLILLKTLGVFEAIKTLGIINGVN